MDYLKLPVENVGKISDGFHTFDELYDHRIALWIAYCKLAEQVGSTTGKNFTWRSKLHSDESSWEGWFILGLNYSEGKQITYHLPIKKWEECGFAKTLDKAPEFDGHTPEDVLKRIANL